MNFSISRKRSLKSMSMCRRYVMYDCRYSSILSPPYIVLSALSLQLNWDLHFLPLSFQCGGLYQKIKDYTFVGKMDDTFYQELGHFLQHYPNLKTEIEQAFKMQGKEDDKSVGTEHQAALHARKYFTPNTIRKVLQYYAIDYTLLGLSIPDWAEDILQQDETFLH